MDIRQSYPALAPQPLLPVLHYASMSFGRQKNMVRRTYRPNGSYHRQMRRRNVDHPFAPYRVGAKVLVTLFALPLRLFKRRRHW
jgi:hypothetical protein